MLDRLAIFCLDDDRARWRAILWSWLAGCVAGVFASASTFSLTGLAVVCLSVSLATFFVFTASYLREQTYETNSVSTRREFFDYTCAAAAAAAFAVLDRTLTNPETVHAAATRIKENIGVKPVSEYETNAIMAAIMADTRKSGKPFPDQRLISDYSAVSVASAYSEAMRHLAKDPGRYFRADRTSAITNGSPNGIFLGGSALLTRVRVVSTPNPGANGIVLACPRCEVVILYGTLEKVTQKIDFATWFKCEFIESRIFYGGGNFVMCECSFKDCTFDFAPSVPLNLRKMIEAGTAVYPLIS
jgi:hypothetical protein